VALGGMFIGRILWSFTELKIMYQILAQKLLGFYSLDIRIQTQT
jgi:hypothetical protein